MPEIIETKVRRVGTSFGVLLPNELIKREGITEGQNIEITILKRNLHLLKRAFGKAKGAEPFEREHKDRL